MRSEASLRKTLLRLNRCMKLFESRIRADSIWVLQCNNKAELLQTQREIIHFHLVLTNVSRELTWTSRRLYALIAGKRSRPIKQILKKTRKAPSAWADLRYAFAAVPIEKGANVVRIFESRSGSWYLEEHGVFENWKEAKFFAERLNKNLGISPKEALKIVIGSGLGGGVQRLDTMPDLPHRVLPKRAVG